MSISDKIRVVLSIMWARIAVDVLTVTNLVCTIVTAQELVKKGKK